MSEGTTIEWTHRPGTIPATMNALVGCQKVSEGCRRCYAIEVAHIRAGNPLPVMQEKFGGTTKSEGGKRVWTGSVTLTDKALLEPLTKKKPRTYFVNALSDLFYEQVPDEWIDKHFAVFALCPQHTFIVLTKRPERMKAYVESAKKRVGAIAFVNALRGVGGVDPETLRNAEQREWPLPNVWLGVSVEDQAAADKRIPLLLKTPAAVRFISAEPLLGAANLDRIVLKKADHAECGQPPVSMSCLRGWHGGANRPERTQLDWVICGGESGPGARPMHPDWARSLRDQCVAAGVSFFFKQWGEWGDVSAAPYEGARAQAEHIFTADGKVLGVGACGNGMVDPGWRPAGGAWMRRVGKKAAGHVLDGKVWQQFPEAR